MALLAPKKYLMFLDTRPSIEDDENAIELTHFAGAIEFKNVWFQYINDEWVLKDVSFQS